MAKARAWIGLTMSLCLGLLPPCAAWAQVSPFESEGQPVGGQQSGGGGGQGGGTSNAGGAPEAQEQISSPQASTRGVQIGPLPESVQSVTGENVSPLDQKVTVRVKDAPLGTFLDTISAQAKVNFIIAKGLEQSRVTAFLQGVKVREALQVLLEMEGISYERVGRTNTFTIRRRAAAAPQTVTRIYTLSYISLIAIAQPGSTGSAAASGQFGGLTFNSTSTPPTGASVGGGGSKGPSSNIPFLAVIQSVLSPLGRVTVDPRTNSIVITDVPEVFPQIEQLIAELDKKVPQVMIEAQIVEIDADKINDLGIEWGGANGELASYVGPARLTDWPLRPGIFSGNQLGFFYPPPGTPVSFPFLASASSSGSSTTGASSSSSGSSGSSGQAGGSSGGSTVSTLFSTGVQGNRGLFYGVFSLAELSAILRALVQTSEARFLGKPKVLTLNNQAASIQISQDAAVGIATNILSGSSGTSSTTAERHQIGLTMDVTPQVNRDGYITLLITPSFTDVVASNVSTPSNPLFDPITRSVNTLVRVKNGQTVVLGGLLQSKETKTVRKVPLLGYIPVLGWLFTSVTSERNNTDLVIFITPTIVND